jgi:hypothetical protein
MSRHFRGSTSRIKPQDRPSIELAEDTLDPRDKFAKNYGIHPRTLARKLKPHTRIIAGVAYVFREASKRSLAGMEPHNSRKRHRATV